MIGFILGLVVVGTTPEYAEFKKVEYEVIQYLGDEYSHNSCKDSLASVAYGFAKRETGNGKGLKQKNKNNLFGLRYGVDKRWVNFRSYDIKEFTPNGYNKYQNRRDAIFDFMLMFHAHGCNLTPKYAGSYKNGRNGGMGGVNEYYNSIRKFTKQYQKEESSMYSYNRQEDISGTGRYRSKKRSK